jgi:hypothetical protein
MPLAVRRRWPSARQFTTDLRPLKASRPEDSGGGGDSHVWELGKTPLSTPAGRPFNRSGQMS